jgi:hypothetical protein
MGKAEAKRRRSDTTTNNEQRTTNNEQRTTKNEERRTKNELRATNYELHEVEAHRNDAEAKQVLVSTDLALSFGFKGCVPKRRQLRRMFSPQQTCTVRGPISVEPVNIRHAAT